MPDLVPPELLLAYFVLVGAAVGSFVNVVIARLPEGLSVVRPRSRCPACEAGIAWYDNIPILSWLVLRGRCRRCRAPISPRYLIVEAIVALLFGAFFLRFGLTWELLVWLPLTAALVAITFLDIDHWWVPDVITLPAIALVLLAALLPGRLGIAAALIGAVPALLLWGLAWVFERVTGREGLGFGDIKLLALMGLALGSLPALNALFLAAVQGSVVGIIVVAFGGHRANESSTATPTTQPGEGSDEAEEEWVPHPRAIPFGPFLVLGTLEAVLLPQFFDDLPQRLAGWMASGLGVL